ERALYQGYLAATAVVASGLGPVAGGLLTRTFGWRSSFIANLSIAAIAMMLILRLPPGTGTRPTLRFDWPGLGLFSIVITSLLLAMEFVRRPLDSGSIWLVGLLLASGIGL